MSPFLILFSYNFLNLRIGPPLTRNVLLVSLNLSPSKSWYSFSSISANVSVFKHLIACLFIIWSWDVK